MKVEEQWILILKPTKVIKRWLEQFARQSGQSPFVIAKISLEIFRENSSVYLLPDYIKSNADGVDFIRKHYKTLLEYELNRYVLDKQYWPEKLSFELFAAMFELNFYPNFSRLD